MKKTVLTMFACILACAGFSQIASSISLRSAYTAYQPHMSFSMTDINRTRGIDVIEVDTSRISDVQNGSECGYDALELFIVPVEDIPLLLMQTSQTHCPANWDDVRDVPVVINSCINEIINLSSSQSPPIPAYQAVMLVGSTQNVIDLSSGSSTDEPIIVSSVTYAEANKKKPAFRGAYFFSAFPRPAGLEQYRRICVLLKRIADGT
jgi:hypothetical protein